MKKQKLIVLSAILVACITFGAAGTAMGHSFKTGDTVNISNTEVIDETLFVSGKNIDIAGTVNGDVFCAGQSVTVSGVVNGDIMCAAQTLTINGAVNGDVRLAGQSVSINSTVAGNASIGSQSFTLGSGGQVQGDVSIGTSDSTINGVIGRDLAVGGANVTISDKIGRNIKGSVERLNLTSDAKVAGNIQYTSSNELSMASGASVAGTINRTEPPKSQKSDSGALFGMSFGWFVYCLIAMLFAAFALVLLIPRFIHHSSERTIAQPLKTLLVGFIACISVPAVIIILCITVVGIPLAAAIGLLWLVILMASGAFFAYMLGRLILRKSNNAIVLMLVGTTLLVVLHFVPIIGFVAFVATLWFGTGMMLMELYSHTPRPVYNIQALASAAPKHSTKIK